MKRLLVLLVVLGVHLPAQASSFMIFRGSHANEVNAAAADWDCSTPLAQVGTLNLAQWIWSGAVAGTYEFKMETSACDWTSAYGSGAECVVGTNCTLDGGANSSWTALGGATYTVNARYRMEGGVSAAIWKTNAAGVAITSVTQNTPAGTVDPGTTVKIRVQTASVLPADQYAYVRWSADGWFTSNVVAAVRSSGTNYDANIVVPDFYTPLVGFGISYYALVSADAALATDGFDADLASLTLANNAGANYALDVYDVANAWHVPTLAEPSGVASMRNPLDVTGGTSTVYFYTGNQFQNPTPGYRASNQTGLKLHYKKGAAAWATLDGVFDSEAGDNKFWRAELPSPFTSGQEVLYVLEIDCSDRDPTYLYGAGGVMHLTGDLTKARAVAPTVNPWSFTVQVALGSGYHTPTAAEPAGHTMRNPVAPDARVTNTVKVWYAEPDAGDTDPVSFVKVLYTFDGVTWADSGNLAAITIDNQDGKDYYSYDINIAGKTDGTVLSYYFYVKYDAAGVSDSYYYWDGAASAVTASDATAKTGAFSVTLAGMPIPTLSEWALIVSLLVMAAFAVRALRRRNVNIPA